MVPKSPEVTAKQIAGEQANAAAAQALAQGQGQGEGQAGQGQGESETPREGAASSAATKGGAVKKGQSPNNQSPEKGELQTANAANADSRGELGGADATAGTGKIENEPWFAKLPPSLQSAIQAKARGRAPRGYEERLKRYFESVD
jgi:hypothetical protein